MQGNTAALHFGCAVSPIDQLLGSWGQMSSPARCPRKRHKENTKRPQRDTKHPPRNATRLQRDAKISTHTIDRKGEQSNHKVTKKDHKGTHSDHIRHVCMVCGCFVSLSVSTSCSCGGVVGDLLTLLCQRAHYGIICFTTLISTYRLIRY